MKKSLIYVLLLGAIILSACGGGAAATEEPAAPADGSDASGTMTERCGDTSKLADKIYLYNWVEYIDPAIYDQFKEECGVEVGLNNFHTIRQRHGGKHSFKLAELTMTLSSRQITWFRS